MQSAGHRTSEITLSPAASSAQGLLRRATSEPPRVDCGWMVPCVSTLWRAFWVDFQRATDTANLTQCWVGPGDVDAGGDADCRSMLDADRCTRFG